MQCLWGAVLLLSICRILNLAFHKTATSLRLTITSITNFLTYPVFDKFNLKLLSFIQLKLQRKTVCCKFHYQTNLHILGGKKRPNLCTICQTNLPDLCKKVYFSALNVFSCKEISFNLPQKALTLEIWPFLLFFFSLLTRLFLYLSICLIKNIVFLKYVQSFTAVSA